jgi:hypothetical protein
MRKFNDILNEDYEGEFDNSKAVDAIVAEYDFIKKVLCGKIIRDCISKPVLKDTIVDTVSEDSFNSSVDKNGELKYLGINFRIDEKALKEEGMDVGRYFTQVRECLSEIFKLKDDKITMHDGWYMKFQLDYQLFKQSDFFRSLKGMDKYNL